MGPGSSFGYYTKKKDADRFALESAIISYMEDMSVKANDNYGGVKAQP